MIKLNEKSEQILKKWKYDMTRDDFINEAINEYDIYRTMVLRPSTASEYDQFVDSYNTRNKEWESFKK